LANIFTWDVQDIDLKECVKLRTNCQQMDTMVMQFNVYDYDIPVDLTNFNITFVAKKADGTIYGQVENITKTGNLLTITCSSQLTSITGRTIGIIEVIDNLGNRKSSYFIVLNVSGLVSEDDRVVSRNFVDILEKFDDDVNIAVSLSTSFKEDIAEAQAISDDFAIKIPQASVVNTTLNATIGNANTIQSTLNSTISTGNTLESRLSSDITAGNTVKSNLEANIVTASTDNDTLTTTIVNAETKLQEFKNYDTTQLVPLSNTMLNEMYCNKELLSINHGLDGYPVVKMTYTEYGAGIGGAGNFPAGADSDCNLMRNKTIYTDNNNLTLYVPQNYYIASPSINKLNDYKYVVTFLNSTRSILIELIEGTISEDIKLINDSITNINSSISDLIYPTATGSSTALIVPMQTLANGYAKTFIVSANNNGSATTINGKHLYKPNTTTSPNLIAGKSYTVWYNLTGDCFFIKASAEGDANLSDVLATKKFSNDNDTGLIGLMPNNGALNSTIATAGGIYTIPLGYTSGGIITAPSLATVTSQGTVTNNNQLLNGYKCISNGVLYTGNIPSKTAQTYTPSTSVQTISAGQYISETQTISAITGNATINDVIAGKGFNSANGIGLVGIASILSLGGANYAQGNVPSGSSVTLSFTPKIVILNQGGRLFMILNGGFGFPVALLADVRSTYDKSVMSFNGDISSYLSGNTIIMWCDSYWAFGY
jgi:hypothetical protein